MVLDHIHYFFEFTGCIPTGENSAASKRIWAIGTAMAALEFFMIYAKAFRRGDDFYPLNAIFQDLMLLCIVWQGIDWLREKKYAKGIGAIAAVLCWPYVVVVFLLLFPGVQEMPIASTIVAFVITSPLPMWTTITDGGWSFLLGGALLYALRGRRKVQLTVWALVIFLCDFVLTFGMACRQEDFVWTQMFTDYYEWFGVAAVLLMLLYNGQRGSGHKQLFYWFYPAHVYLLYGASCLVYNVLRCIWCRPSFCCVLALLLWFAALMCVINSGLALAAGQSVAERQVSSRQKHRPARRLHRTFCRA